MSLLIFLCSFLILCLIVGNIWYVFFFRLLVPLVLRPIRLSLKVAEYKHKDIDGRKDSINHEDFDYPRITSDIQVFNHHISQIKSKSDNECYTREQQYEESVKQSLPRLIKGIDWLIEHIPNILSRKNKRNQPDAKRTNEGYYLHLVESGGEG